MIYAKLFCIDESCPSRLSCERGQRPTDENTKIIETTYNREEDAINCDYYQAKASHASEDK